MAQHSGSLAQTAARAGGIAARLLIAAAAVWVHPVSFAADCALLANCGGPMPLSVINAAGVPPGDLNQIQLVKGSIEPQVSRATLAAIVAAHKAHGAGQKLSLSVSADAGLNAEAAHAQATARAAALTRRLIGAGMPAAELAITAH